MTVLQKSKGSDAMVMLEMAKIGADLRKPHQPEFAFEVYTQTQAKAMAQELAQLGYDVKLYAPDDENTEYSVIAKQVIVLDLSMHNQLSTKFEALAEKIQRQLRRMGRRNCRIDAANCITLAHFKLSLAQSQISLFT